jgi:hypothetical protein
MPALHAATPPQERRHEAVRNARQHAQKDEPEYGGGPVELTLPTPLEAAPHISGAVALLAALRQHEAVLDAAAALKYVGVARRRVALADNVRRAQLEFGRQRRSAGPLDTVIFISPVMSIQRSSVSFWFVLMGGESGRCRAKKRALRKEMG